MKFIIIRLAILLALIFPAFAENVPSAKVAYMDMEKSLGVVPTFFKLYPKSAIGGAWEAHKNLASKGLVPSKYKELIGLAVSSQVPCVYCIYFHTKAAKMHNASDEEIAESVAIAAQTRRWSTVINGANVDYKLFKKDVSLIVKYLNTKDKVKMDMKKGAYSKTRNEITQTFGRVPMFLESYPAYAIDGAWKDLKAIQLTDTSIPNKYKQLIAVGVSAQIPCRYCVYFHTQMAKVNGATDEEIKEMIAVAAETRHWSTFINGMNIDYKSFQKEVDMMFATPKE